jgi:hypothetical protein
LPLPTRHRHDFCSVLGVSKQVLCLRMPSPTKHCFPPGRRSGARICARLALGLLAVLARGDARADWEIGASAGTFYDDNLTRAQEAVDKRAAGAVTANLIGTDYIQFTGSDGVALTLNGRAELFDRYAGLTNFQAGGTVAYRHKFGIGYLAPWVAVSGGASYDDFREDLRTSTLLAVRAETGKRFAEQFDASVGLYYERRYDDHGEPVVPGISGKVFDLAGQGAFLRAGYAPTYEVYFDARVGARRGDVESTSQRSLPIFLASSAITQDPVWGDPKLFAYRLRGTTWSGDFTTSYALSSRSSLDLVYRYGFTRAAQGLEYTTNAIVLTFDYRF